MLDVALEIPLPSFFLRGHGEGDNAHGPGIEILSKAPNGPAFAGSVAPETMIDAGPKVKGRKKKVTFRFSASDPGATFECQMDTHPFAACRSPLTMKVKVGKHVFRVRATDRANRRDESPAEFHFKRRP